MVKARGQSGTGHCRLKGRVDKKLGLKAVNQTWVPSTGRASPGIADARDARTIWRIASLRVSATSLIWLLEEEDGGGGGGGRGVDGGLSSSMADVFFIIAVVVTETATTTITPSVITLTVAGSVGRERFFSSALSPLETVHWDRFSRRIDGLVGGVDECLNREIVTVGKMARVLSFSFSHRSLI